MHCEMCPCLLVSPSTYDPHSGLLPDGRLDKIVSAPFDGCFGML
ncbi:hypothetical protein DsansV1_C10g0103031 [Dioscorea sansibarensis]